MHVKKKSLSGLNGGRHQALYRDTEQNDNVFIFTTEKSNFVTIQRLIYQKKRKN